MKKDIGDIYSGVIHEKFNLRLLAIYAVLVVFLIVMFQRIGTPGMFEFLKQTNWTYAAIGGFLLIGAVFVRAYRLHLMLLKVKEVDWKNTLLIQVISQTISVYTTGFAESVKSLPLKKMEGIPEKKSVEVFVLEKTFDTFTNIGILVLALPYLEKFFPHLAGKLVNISMLLVGCMILAGFFLYQTRYSNIPLKDVGMVLGMTFANMLVKMGAFYFLLSALGINITIQLLFVIYSILTVIPMLAIVPFGLGIKEPLIIYFASVTVGVAESSAFAILVNIVVFLSYTLLSAVLLFIYSKRKEQVVSR